MTKIGTSNYTQCEEMYFNHLERMRGVLLMRIGERSYDASVTQCTGQVMSDMLHLVGEIRRALGLKLTFKIYFKIVGYLSINKARSEKKHKSVFIQVRSAPNSISYHATCYPASKCLYCKFTRTTLVAY